jgi:hypothetical protein
VILALLSFAVPSVAVRVLLPEPFLGCFLKMQYSGCFGV